MPKTMTANETLKVALKFVAKIVASIGQHNLGPEGSDRLAVAIGCLLLSAAADLQEFKTREQFMADVIEHLKGVPRVDVEMWIEGGETTQH
jgi:hypothetical protein